MEYDIGSPLDKYSLQSQPVAHVGNSGFEDPVTVLFQQFLVDLGNSVSPRFNSVSASGWQRTIWRYNSEPIDTPPRDEDPLATDLAIYDRRIWYDVRAFENLPTFNTPPCPRGRQEWS